MIKNEIIILHHQGISNREIGRRLKISRTTVNKYVNLAKEKMKYIEEETSKTKILQLQNELVSAPKRKSVRINRVFKGELEQRFYELLQLNEQRNFKLGINKQHLTAALLHKTLLDEGFKVGISTIQYQFKDYMNKNKECFIKQEYNYG